MRLDYWLFMNEAEGYDDIARTRSAKINAIGREMRDAGYAGKIVPAPVFLAYCNNHGIFDITREEIRYIEEKWL